MNAHSQANTPFLDVYDEMMLPQNRRYRKVRLWLFWLLRNAFLVGKPYKRKDYNSFEKYLVTTGIRQSDILYLRRQAQRYCKDEK